MAHNIECLEKLINSFSKLSGVGYKTAEKYAYNVINLNDEDVKLFAENLINTKKSVKFCSICGNFTQEDNKIRFDGLNVISLKLNELISNMVKKIDLAISKSKFKPAGMSAIKIENKEGVPGIVVTVADGTVRKSVHIPVVITDSGINCSKNPINQTSL